MNKTITIFIALMLFGYIQSEAQNVGIGIATPLAKIHVNQTAAVDAILVNHSGTAGNSIELNQTDAGNGSSALWIRNSGTNRAFYAQILNAASITEVARTFNQGLGIGLIVNQTNTGASSIGVLVEHDGSGVTARGFEADLNSATNSAIGYSLFHAGTGSGFYTSLSNATSAGIGWDLRHAGIGRGSYMDLSGATNTSTASAIYHAGTGRGSYINLSNPANTATAVGVIHNGTSTGRGLEISMTGTTGTGIGIGLFHSGLGRGGNISLNNPANTDIGWGVWNSGTGMGIYSQSVGDAFVGFVTGTDGTPGTFIQNNAAATNASTGIFATYAGTVGGALGGGNAGDFQHTGTNGNAVDIFMGNPAAAAGPANTTSEYPTLSVAHMATGTSPTAGLIKSAISASNNSADPTILVSNNGNQEGDGINVFTVPVSGAPIATIYNQSAAIYSQANGINSGIGVFGFGGDVGILGYSSGGSGFAVYGYGNTGAAGAKSFHIDHPLDPQNKTLSHYSIESDEILNMYRGTIELDANGQATIELPNYFDAVNVNPSYQLTAIGTATQPYVATEIANNQFTVSGAPNTKVSWMVTAERNDPTIQYFSEKYNLKENVRAKRPHEVGRYITPEAYGENETKALWYNANRAILSKERDVIAKQQKAMATPKTKAAPEQSATTESSNDEKREKPLKVNQTEVKENVTEK